jgi:diphosphomevalonate decarboxylase
MMTSIPPVFYWAPVTMEIMGSVKTWRKTGIPVAYTIDAGPNVHIICENEVEDVMKTKLEKYPGVKDVLTAHPGSGAKLI